MSTLVVNVLTFLVVMLVGQIAVNVSDSHTVTFNYGFFTMIAMFFGLMFSAMAACIDQEELDKKLKASEKEKADALNQLAALKANAANRGGEPGSGDRKDQRGGKTTLRSRLESRRDRRAGQG